MAGYSVKLTLGYSNSEQNRQLTFSDVAESLIPDVKDNIIAINDSIEAGTDGGLTSFFKDDDGNNFSGITAAQIIAETVKSISLPGGAS